MQSGLSRKIYEQLLLAIKFCVCDGPEDLENTKDSFSCISRKNHELSVNCVYCFCPTTKFEQTYDLCFVVFMRCC